ncbi:MAG: energy-coupling factor transporter transmembrane component T family protein [Caldisericaceae bacterium]
MPKNSALGQYQYSDSIIHKLDPRLKILFTLWVVILLFLIQGFYGYLVILAYAFLLICVSRIKFSSVMYSLRPILFLTVFTLVFQIFFTPGTVIYQLYFVKITQQGINLAIYITLRLILLTVFTFILTSTTSTVQLAEGLQKIISPLKVLRFPSDDIALMISISLQFVPILFDETDRIMKAQISRGAEFNKGGFISRAKNFLPLLLPLLLSAFNRADQLANAMEARGFVVGAKRTSYREVKFTRNDYLFVLATILISFVALLNFNFIHF